MYQLRIILPRMLIIIDIPRMIISKGRTSTDTTRRLPFVVTALIWVIFLFALYMLLKI